MIEKSADEIVSFLGTLGAQSRVSIPDGCSGAFTDLAASKLPGARSSPPSPVAARTGGSTFRMP